MTKPMSGSENEKEHFFQDNTICLTDLTKYDKQHIVHQTVLIYTQHPLAKCILAFCTSF